MPAAARTECAPYHPRLTPYPSLDFFLDKIGRVAKINTPAFLEFNAGVFFSHHPEIFQHNRSQNSLQGCDELICVVWLRRVAAVLVKTPHFR